MFSSLPHSFPLQCRRQLWRKKQTHEQVLKCEPLFDKKIKNKIWSLQGSQLLASDDWNDLPLDAPGGASYIKLSPFLTRSSPISNLKVRKQYVENINLVGGGLQKMSIGLYWKFKKYSVCTVYHYTKQVSLKINSYSKSSFVGDTWSHSAAVLCNIYLTCCCKFPALSDRPA